MAEFKKGSNEREYTPGSEQEAWVGIIVACAASDGDISEVELDYMTRTIAFKSMFEGMNVKELFENVMKAANEYGGAALVNGCINAISPENKETLFAVLVELVIVDGRLEEGEEKLLGYVYSKLEIEDSVAEKIIEVLLIKQKGNYVFVSNSEA